MAYRLTGRKVLITGGSRGLGAVLCETFASQGAHIVVNYHSDKTSAQKVVQAAKKHGVEAFDIQGVRPQLNASAGRL